MSDLSYYLRAGSGRVLGGAMALALVKSRKGLGDQVTKVRSNRCGDGTCPVPAEAAPSSAEYISSFLLHIRHRAADMAVDQAPGAATPAVDTAPRAATTPPAYGALPSSGLWGSGLPHKAQQAAPQAPLYWSILAKPLQ